MPGIVGIVGGSASRNVEEDLDVMLDSMMHEPYYVCGKYLCEELDIYIGWICHRGSFSDCMPLLNEKKDIALIFSGEEFSDKDSRYELKRRGHEFNVEDASYLVHLYEEHGSRYFSKLNGWFGGAIIDLRRRCVTLFNDRYSMHRIYYYENEDEFVFGSEAKALLKIRRVLRRMDYESLGQFLSCGCVITERTLFSKMFVIPGGSKWTFRKGRRAEKEIYFKIEDWENAPTMAKEEFYGRLKETMLNILPKYMGADQPIGMSLTSGLDTRMIMACIERPNGALPCYTFCGMYRETLDARIASEVAAACGQPHILLKLGSDFLLKFGNLAERTIYITDGCHDAFGAYDIYFNRLGREIAPVRMTGKFGSEVVRDHSMFKPSFRSKRILDPDFRKYMEMAGRTFLELKKRHALSFAVMNEMPMHEYGRLASEMALLTVRTPYMDNDLVELMYKAPRHVRRSNEFALRLIQENNSYLASIMTDRGFGGPERSLASRVAELFFFALFKTEYAYMYQLPDWFSGAGPLVSALKLDNLIVGRYQLPYYQKWIRYELSEYIRDVLLDGKANKRGYLAKGVVETLLSKKTAKSWNYVVEINKILTVELIHKLLIEDI